MSVYAVSDLHGCKHFYDKIKEFLKPEDKVYFLGDAGDRGMKSWETIKLIAADPQFVYMQGNHEDMLWRAMRDNIEGHGYSHDMRLLFHNGGQSTFEGWLADGAKEGWIDYLRKLPTHIEYVRPDGKRVMLSHAGYTPEEDGGLPWGYDLVWDRQHFYEGWPEGEYFDNIYIVHGHTPTPLMDCVYDGGDNTLAGAYKYSEGHKFCIDNGAVFTGVCTLFNLDTFESHVFEAGANEIGVD